MPLGPGYTIAQQQIEVRYVAAPAPHLAVRATYRLLNTGNQPLASIEVFFGEGTFPGRQNLRATVDARETLLEPAAGRGPGAFRIPLDSAWPQKQKRELTLAYELLANPAKPSRLALGPDAFYLASGWHPVLQSPKGTFAKGGAAPKKWELTVIVPAGFRVHSSGRARGERHQSAGIAHRFEQRQGDLEPFVVAGQYQEKRVRKGEIPVVFWSLQPLPTDQVERAGQRIAATVRAFEAAFGPRDKNRRPVWIVECPGGNAGLDGERQEAIHFLQKRCTPLPEAVLMPARAFRVGIADDRSLSDAEHGLAHTWFGYLSAPLPETALLFPEALADYAVAVAGDGGEKSESRTTRIKTLLQRYDRDPSSGKEGRLSALTETDPPSQLSLGKAKAKLFLFALEDLCGRGKLNRGLARMIHARRNEHWGLEDFRSALEAETSQNLADFFRLWLNLPGIPDDFRARYAAKGEPEK